MNELLQKEMLDKIAKKKTRHYRSVDDWIYSETNGIVQTGPFAGMILLKNVAWDDGNLSTKCLGCYEQELHPFIEYEIERLAKIPNPKIVDLGCAEGYYMIGFGRRLAAAVLYGVDISPECLAIAHQAADANGVVIHTGLPMDDVMVDADLCIVDVEGFEDQYLDKEKFPSLARADIVVECHDYDEMSYTRMLTDRFSDTHDVECIFEGARNPNAFAILTKQKSLHRWMAVCEGRPCMMNWLVMKRRT